MSALIEELKKEHSEIVAALNEIKELGILSGEGQAKLLSLKVSLLSHLKKEDEQFYPLLRKEAKNNKNLQYTLDLFPAYMEEMSRAVNEFFNKYPEGILDEELSHEFESLFIALDARIRKERDLLFTEFEKIIK